MNTVNNSKKKKGKTKAAGRGSSNVFQAPDNKVKNGNVKCVGSTKVSSSSNSSKNSSPKVNNTPIIVDGKCLSCSATDTTINESMKCMLCSKYYHALCRNKTGTVSNNSVVSSVSFLDTFNPISEHYGNHANRWGHIVFICQFCKPKLSTKLTVNNKVAIMKDNESQTFVSGNLHDHDCSLDTSAISTKIDVVGLNDSLNTKLSVAQTQTDIEDENVDVNLNSSFSTILTKLNKISEQSLDINSGIKSLTNNSNEIMSEIKNVFDNGIPKSSAACTNSTDVLSADNDYKGIDKPCTPYNGLHKQFLSPDENESLLKLIDECDNFSEIKSKNSSRDVVYFGEFGYRYGTQSHNPCPAPIGIQDIIDKLNVMFPKTIINSCLITRYKTGNNSCPPHSDNESYIAPCSDIATLSIGNERTMQFTDINGIADPIKIALPDNSLLSFSRASQEHWKHEIISSDSNICRYSLTFRQVAPYYSNSTLVIGDSNTENLKFGAGRKTFGVWMPGERIRASRVNGIPTPEAIVFPYRHFVIHCGINDLRAYNPKPVNVIANELENKAAVIANAFPYSKVHISLLLPSKDRNLNKLITELNKFIAVFCKKYQNMSVINHSNLSDPNGLLRINFGRHFDDGSPKMHDFVHLGAHGIKIFCMNIKESIVKMKKKSSKNETEKSITLSNSYQKEYPYFRPNPIYKPMNDDYFSYSQARFPLYDGDYSQALQSESFQLFNLKNAYNGYQQ